MALGLSATIANNILDALCRSVAWSEPDAVWVQLHVTGEPGANGTSNVATETDRIQATFASAASGGAISNTSQLQWTNVAGTEDYLYFSAWSASTSGTFLFSGTITANAVTAGDTFTIPVGDLDVSFSIAS